MKKLSLVEICPENYAEATGLAVSDSQKQFIADITKTLADAYVYKDSVFRLASNSKHIIGYLLLYPFTENGLRIMNIARIAIDQRFQRKGYGKLLLEEAIALSKSLEPNLTRMKVSALPVNTYAIGFYEKFGFVATGKDGSEISFNYNL